MAAPDERVEKRSATPPSPEAAKRPRYTRAVSPFRRKLKSPSPDDVPTTPPTRFREQTGTNKTKALRLDRVRYDMDLFTQIYNLLAPVAAKAADARALGTAPDDAYIAPIDFHEHRELRDEIRDTLKTHVRQLL